MSKITEFLNVPQGDPISPSGELAGSATALQMPDIPCRGVVFKAVASNVGNVYIGGSTVTLPTGSTNTTAGLELTPGEMTPYIPCTDNMNEMYRICDNAGDDLTYFLWT